MQSSLFRTFVDPPPRSHAPPGLTAVMTCKPATDSTHQPIVMTPIPAISSPQFSQTYMHLDRDSDSTNQGTQRAASWKQEGYPLTELKRATTPPFSVRSKVQSKPARHEGSEGDGGSRSESIGKFPSAPSLFRGDVRRDVIPPDGAPPETIASEPERVHPLFWTGLMDWLTTPVMPALPATEGCTSRWSMVALPGAGRLLNSPKSEP